ncbi:hypothetical protein ACFU3E_02655 [Streptomyces sp. NPDC057424]|uniref:hypothetical protein n=1 Tax=Streptomyces sp. NPDC057424 TaxID=3346127 RepID=UPI0036B0F7FC
MGETVSGLGNGITVVALPLIAVVVLDADSTDVGLIGDAVGYRSAMWIMTGVVALSWLILLMSPIRREPDLPQNPEPAHTHA